MKLEINLIKFDNSILSVTYEATKKTLEVTKKTLWLLLIKPHWVLASVTIFTILANKETFPTHNLFQSIKNFFGEWLTFALEFDIAIAGMFWLLFLLVILILIGRAIKNWDDCYSFSYIPIHILVQLANTGPAEPLYKIVEMDFKFYIYISALYTNYLIMATPNYSELYLIVNTDQTLQFAVMGTPIMLLVVIENLCRGLGNFLGSCD